MFDCKAVPLRQAESASELVGTWNQIVNRFIELTDVWWNRYKTMSNKEKKKWVNENYCDITRKIRKLINEFNQSNEVSLYNQEEILNIS